MSTSFVQLGVNCSSFALIFMMRIVMVSFCCIFISFITIILLCTCRVMMLTFTAVYHAYKLIHLQALVDAYANVMAVDVKFADNIHR